MFSLLHKVRKRYFPGFLLVFMICVCLGCEPTFAPSTLFVLREPASTGITFANTLQESTDFNILSYLYYYNGGGVAVGDINQDGLPDIYFSANEGPNKLYLNKGEMEFSDITEQAGVAGNAGWSTGVNMADVNGDGYLDIYLCQLGDYEGITGENQLFINQKDGTFRDEAASYGLNFTGFSTQSAFFDYDRDGDLDMYLLTHSVHANDTYRDTSIRKEFHPTAGDRLFENRGSESTPQFVEVTREAGIYSSRLGYGLGLAISDVDNNGCPDIYVGNDFHENDYLYLNNCDGTFTESLEKIAGHSSHFTMGVDIVDINQDGWMDITSLDMKPWREDILKTSEPPNSFDIYQYKLKQGYSYQYPRNAIQINQGMGPSGQLRLGDLAQLLEMEATDWSWSCLWADWDLNGKSDVFISNGIYRRPNDMDYINFISDPQVVASLKGDITEENLTFVQKMPQVPLPNKLFSQVSPLHFEEVGADWGMNKAGFSSGAAYADLDRDGDLDLIVNEQNAHASVYENLSDSLLDNHYLEIELKGQKGNSFGLGAQVIAYKDSIQWKKEMYVVRGFHSSVEPIIHFGLGNHSTLDSVEVIWPDQSRTIQRKVPVDRVLTLSHEKGTQRVREPLDEGTLMNPVEGRLSFSHEENTYVDFNSEILLPRMISREGPALAVGDVNGDGREDLFIGGAKFQTSQLFIQLPSGEFTATSQPAFSGDSLCEDVGAVFFDADGDGDQDLYVVSGGNEYRGRYQPLMDRLYLNEGQGKFTRSEGRLPEMYVNGSCVSPGDIDGDGDMDLFVGGRSVAKNYGVIPRSYILENDGKGYFSDQTAQYAEALEYPGLVTDALWMHLNEDAYPDLLLAGEWMPIRAFVSEQGKWIEATETLGFAQTHGWWNTLLVEDLDGDGDQDILGGNLGLNTAFEASLENPCTLYIRDFDQNGSIDPIMCSHKEGKDYPIAFRDELLTQLPSLKKKFTSYAAYAASPIEHIFPKEELAKAEKRFVYSFASAYFENQGGGKFQKKELPMEAQIAPIYAFTSLDTDSDGLAEGICWGGNFSGVGPFQGSYDASLGGLALIRSGANFEYIPPRKSGFWVEGEVRNLLKLSMANDRQVLIVAKNNSPIQLFELPSSLSF